MNTSLSFPVTVFHFAQHIFWQMWSKMQINVFSQIFLCDDTFTLHCAFDGYLCTQPEPGRYHHPLNLTHSTTAATCNFWSYFLLYFIHYWPLACQANTAQRTHFCLFPVGNAYLLATHGAHGSRLLAQSDRESIAINYVWKWPDFNPVWALGTNTAWMWCKNPILCCKFRARSRTTALSTFLLFVLGFASVSSTSVNHSGVHCWIKVSNLKLCHILCKDQHFYHTTCLTTALSIQSALTCLTFSNRLFGNYADISRFPSQLSKWYWQTLWHQACTFSQRLEHRFWQGNMMKVVWQNADFSFELL